MGKRKEQDTSSGELFAKKLTEQPEHKVKHPNPGSTIPKESTPEKQYGGLTVDELSAKFGLIARRHDADHLAGSWNGTDSIALTTSDPKKIAELLTDMAKMQVKRRFNATTRIVSMVSDDGIVHCVSILLPGKLIKTVLAHGTKG
jgi:hypothetical protein